MLKLTESTIPSYMNYIVQENDCEANHDYTQNVFDAPPKGDPKHNQNVMCLADFKDGAKTRLVKQKQPVKKCV